MSCFCRSTSDQIEHLSGCMHRVPPCLCRSACCRKCLCHCRMKLRRLRWKVCASARTTFEHWRQQAEQAISSVFDFPSARDARLHLLTSGRKLRQRLTAAEQTDDFRYRLRTQFPHPIAYRWRAVEAAKPDLEGYVQVLECAEISTCLLACVAMALAQSVEGVQIRWLGEMAKRLAKAWPGDEYG